ncbi:alpha/beta hydrolase [Flavobacterium sp. Fl-318]|uniref:Alpha/beta hydrolase n=1 Tax=Flavobacterium cupriresistens TaxID=2893885 RepID=A0ABU4RGB2_9FLAO|nr:MULTISPECIES: alpha/beta hydrolase [unclassified Flavobacterium]MDX6191639.1 alpha/beta hydrolase [Flavobacterium sp. Fl-318]UFH41584.1 alpha/beta hydrolase [Flavobacterium sp. F-323]
MSNHTISIGIQKHGLNSQGFFSYSEPKNLIVFIHGFGGTSIGTWNNFPTYITSEEEFAKSDIIFYGYDTFKGQAGDHSGELFKFLNLVENPVANHILPIAQGLPERNYNGIILVAHSLGAILTRQALIFAINENKTWADKVTLALFAPAHHGANIINLAMQALPGLTGLLGIFAKLRYPILNDLDNTEEGIIHYIKERTHEFQNQNKGDCTKAKLVVYAKGDKVVRNIPYLNDIAPIVLAETSHVSVCKPKSGFIEPLDLLKSII